MRRLEEAYRKAAEMEFDRGSRIVCMSDCHRGVGNHGDNFLPNQNVFFAALQYYNERCFTYIELGDGDELWENGRLSRIVECHSDVFWMMSQFYRQGRLHMLYGNHDYRKRNMHYFQKHCESYYCDSQDCSRELFPGLVVRESILLKERNSGRELLLLHGHQGELLNDYLWPLTAFFVKFFWRPLELFGVQDTTSAARNYRRRKKTEHRLERFADKRGLLVMAGHTHRPVLSKPGEGRYMNDGSCVHPRCITAMELEKGSLTLVKWSVLVRHGRNLSVEREVLAGPFLLEEYT